MKKRSGAGTLIVHGNKRLVAIMTGPNQTDEFVIVPLRVNEDCKTKGSPCVRLFHKSQAIPNGQRLVVDATDFAYNDEKLVEVVENIVRRHPSPVIKFCLTQHFAVGGTRRT